MENKLTKKELLNLYYVYSNGYLPGEVSTNCIQVTGCVMYADKAMFHKTMAKIWKLTKRKKRKKLYGK